MCSETSPRISFSHDLRQTDDIVPVRRDTMLLESNSDFEFILTSTIFDQQSCSADELFKNGVILPVQVQKLTPPPPPTVFSSLPPRPNSNEIVNDHQLMVANSDQEKPQSKSFWGFKRSSSLNCDAKKSLICSLPLLSRSNSTGSSVTSKRPSLKESSQKQPLMVKWSNGYNQTQSQQKPPLKKGYGGSYYGNGGVKVSPVLNVPPPYISRATANLFGLGSLLRSGKDNKKNKK
ncbi:hypothetical protein Ddye_015405 [Dipteronia dyeriana]|uniref:Uncharacterized protein n=1 Tax=Dipteronia dyeriana TaxID=168575 RepID=A0AAD9U5J8_9ROSI|nr:hypothetical protein Ddye_015405 [Dipteronia dyeriana]